MKKIFVTVIAIIMTLSLVACGEKPPDGSSASGGSIDTGSSTGRINAADFADPPRPDEEGARIYRDGDFMALQYRHPDMAIIEEKDILSFDLEVTIAPEVSHKYSIIFTKGNEGIAYYPPENNSAVRQDYGDSLYYILDGDTLSLCADRWPFAPEEVQVFFTGYHKDDKYVYQNLTPDGKSNECHPLPDGAFAIYNEQDNSAAAAIVEKYLQQGVPLPTEYGTRVFRDGSFVAVQYKGWRVQQLAEQGCTADRLTFRLYVGSYDYDIAEVKRTGNRWEATITPLDSSAEPSLLPIGKAYCQLEGDVITVFADDWGAQYEELAARAAEERAKDPERVRLEVKVDTVEPEIGNPHMSIAEEVDGNVWLLPSGVEDWEKVQILRSEGEEMPYTVVEQLSMNGSDAYIDRGAAGKGYYYAMRGVSGDKLTTITFFNPAEVPTARWYSGGGEYARETLFVVDDTFNGFALYSPGGELLYSASGKTKSDDPKWDYHLSASPDIGAGNGSYSIDVFVKINDSSLSFEMGTWHQEAEFGADGKPIVQRGSRSGSYSRCR